MPIPSPALPKSLPTLHLYRNLLRESSYLPPAWRQVITSSIVKKFRTHRRDGLHEKIHRSRANQALGTMRAANNGDEKSMERLIHKAFARKGPRRRQILSNFVQSQGPQTSADLEALLSEATSGQETPKSATSSTSGSKNDATKPDHGPKTLARQEPTETPENQTIKAINPTENEFLEKWDLQKLRQLLRSQREVQKHSQITWGTKEIKSLNEETGLPKLNIWNKPINPKSVRNMQANFWRRTADRVMVPLSKGEWDMLQQLAEGLQDTTEWRIPVRRPMAGSHKGEKESSPEWNWEAYADKPIQLVERPRHNSASDMLKGPYQKQRHDAEISPRWFRRTYKQVWARTPKVEQDPQTLKRAITWGSADAKTCAASASQLKLFEGYDSKGKLLKPSQ